MSYVSASENHEFRYFNKYQEEVNRTKKEHKTDTDAICDYSMGVSGEAGEVIDYIKKVVWQGKPLDIAKVQDELGDVLWYVAALASTLGLSLEGIAVHNVEKLRERYPNGFSSKDSENRKEYK